MKQPAPPRHIAAVLCCIIWLLLTAGCETPVGVERLEPSPAQRRLTANVLTTDELSPQARNVLRRWVLSERYEEDPAGAIAALRRGRGDYIGGNGLPVWGEEPAAAIFSRRRNLQLRLP